MNFDIIRTDKADTQLRDLIYYIADDSGSEDVALSYLDKVEHAIMLLAEQPYYGALSRHPSLRRQKYRVLIVENHLIFYKVRKRNQTVIAYAIVDSRQDYVNLVI